MKVNDRLIAAVAERQLGLVTRRQLLRLKMSARSIERRVACGDLAVVFPGVFRLSGAPVTKEQRILAATLWAAPEGVASFATAGALLHLDAVTDPAQIAITVPRSRSVRSLAVKVHRTLELPRIDRVSVDGIPCTSATRTIVDLAGTLSDESLEAAFHSARRLGLTSPAHFARRFETLGGRGRVGSAALRALIERERGTNRALESKLEVKAARLLRRSVMPEPQRQYRIEPYRVDFAWPQHLVVVECDGFAWHGNRLQWKRDRRRVAVIEALGWRVLFVTWDDVTQEPEQTLHRVALALGSAAA